MTSSVEFVLEMGSHGHPSHDGKHFQHLWREHEKCPKPWLIPRSGQPKSGTKHGRDSSAYLTHPGDRPSPLAYRRVATRFAMAPEKLRERTRAVERENRELRRTDETLKAAASEPPMCKGASR